MSSPRPRSTSERRAWSERKRSGEVFLEGVFLLLLGGCWVGFSGDGVGFLRVLG